MTGGVTALEVALLHWQNQLKASVELLAFNNHAYSESLNDEVDCGEVHGQDEKELVNTA